MSRRRAVGVIALCAATIGVAGCGTGSGASAGNTPLNASQTAATATATPLATQTPAPRPTEPFAITRGQLTPGTYITTRFDPPLRFTLGEGWAGAFPDDPDEIAIYRDGGLTGLAITRVARVVDPATGRFVDAPADLIDWLSRHPALDAQAAQPIEIAHLDWWFVDTVATGTEDTFAYGTGNMRVIAGDHTRFYVLPLEGPDLTVVFAASGERFDATLPLVESIVASLTIGPG